MIPKHMHPSWWDKLSYTEPILNYIKRNASSPISPSGGNTFRAFSLPANEVKMVIVGQDVYPNLKDATGVAFAVEAGRLYKDYPFSLKVIADSFCETPQEADTFFDPTLELWIRQGTLLINTALTCRVNHPGSHLHLWKPFMQELIKLLNNEEPKIFLFLGRIAEEWKHFIDDDKHKVLTCPHPAALAYTNSIDKSIFRQTFLQAGEAYKQMHDDEFSWIYAF